MGMNSTPVLRKMSLRRAIWRARMTAKSIRDNSELSGPERDATEWLRDMVKRELRGQPLGALAGVFAVEDGWQRQVLERDPQVVCARSAADVAEALESAEPVEVFASREAQLTVDHLRELCLSGTLQGKTLFVET
jgi:hypothetical protein